MKSFKLNIAKLLEYGTPEALIDAILRTRDRFKLEPPFGVKSGSDDWLAHSFLRGELVAAVRVHWAEHADCHVMECPFTEDSIMQMWVATRKDAYSVDDLRKDCQRMRLAGVKQLFGNVE